jgi:hypothetical protein
MVSVSKALAGNYSEQIGPIFKAVSRKLQARGFLPELLTTQVDKIFEPSQQEFYDQVYNQTLTQLITGVSGNKNASQVLVTASEVIR